MTEAPRPNLLELFTPPELMTGTFGLLCGYSATPRFLEQALRAFTGDAESTRRHRGRLALQLFLDPRAPRIPPHEAAGLYHAPARAVANWPKPCHSMHAKVALLGFGRGDQTERFRLVVSTGNWTEDSANRLLDLVWSIDVGAEADEADRADLQAVARFFRTLRGNYLEIRPASGSAPADALLARAGEMAGRPTSPTRFLSSIDQPLIKGYTAKLRERQAGGCDLLVCGSGFFESGTGRGNQEPQVLRTLVDGLKEAKAIVELRRKDKQVVVNPGTCGALRGWIAEGGPRASGWTVRSPADPGGHGRASLHAKFVLLARRRGQSLSDGWLLLGSGNLSQRGMILPPGKEGNIEAAVLLPVPRLPLADLERHLPLGAVLDGPLEAGEDDDREDHEGSPLPPPPVVGFVHRDASLAVQWADGVPPVPVSVIAADGGAVPLGAGALVLPWAGTTPAVLTIRWADGEAVVPVLEADGSYCRVPAAPLPFSDALDRLLMYPAAPDDDGPEDAPEDDVAEPMPTPRGRGADGPGGRDGMPIYRAMTLVESIADRNNRIPPESLAGWVRHLRWNLREGLLRQDAEAWRALRVDFLGCLAQPGFAPPVWPDDETREAYAIMLDEVRAAWGLTGLPPLGRIHNALSPEEATP